MAEALELLKSQGVQFRLDEKPIKLKKEEIVYE